MKTVLLTGARGILGREVLPRLLAAGLRVRAATSAAELPAGRDHLLWTRLDLSDGGGVEEAVNGADVVIQCATKPIRGSRRVDVEGTARLVEAARRAGVGHFVYPSIIGIDRAAYPYYRNKLAAERIIADGGVPWSVLRATKFHGFLDGLLSMANRLPVLLLPKGFLDQPIDAGEVAAGLVRAAEQGPGGMLDEMAGPEVLNWAELADQWLEVRDVRKRKVEMPLPGEVARAFRQGVTTNPHAAVDGLNWREWLTRKYRS